MFLRYEQIIGEDGMGLFYENEGEKVTDISAVKF